MHEKKGELGGEGKRVLSNYARNEVEWRQRLRGGKYLTATGWENVFDMRE